MRGDRISWTAALPKSHAPHRKAQTCLLCANAQGRRDTHCNACRRLDNHDSSIVIINRFMAHKRKACPSPPRSLGYSHNGLGIALAQTGQPVAAARDGVRQALSAPGGRRRGSALSGHAACGSGRYPSTSSARRSASSTASMKLCSAKWAVRPSESSHDISHVAESGDLESQRTRPAGS
jgi:hypothetical protein